MQQPMDVDVLVVGGGGAGARAAIEAHTCGASVALLCKGLLGKSGTTPQAWPSYEAAFAAADPRDTPQVHFEDTCREGRLLGDENLIWALASEARERVLDLERYGVKFEKVDGKFLQVHHPGQTYPRCLVIKGGGYGLISGLYKELKRRPEITLLPDVMVTRLLQAGGRVVGATALDSRDGSFAAIRAKATILCTGGYEQLWKSTDTAPDTTGDGVALAYRAGAELVDMEMMLYYPTVISHPYGEVNGTLVQYEGLLSPQYVAGKLLNGLGEEFLPPGALPVRDVLTRLMFDEIGQGRGTKNGALYVDITRSPKPVEEIDALLERLQSLPYKNLRDLGIDVKTTPIEVAPGMHYALGGVHIDEWGRTTVSGLYAAGEVASNVHGANRLSGNALAETQVFGTRAGRCAAQEAQGLGALPQLGPDEIGAERQRLESILSVKERGLRPLELKRNLRGLMDRRVGMPRSHEGLNQALEGIRRMRDEDLPRVQAVGPRVFNNDWREAVQADFMLDVAEIVVLSALQRTETRGHHQRTDYPETLDAWLRHTAVKQGGRGPICRSIPVVRLDRHLVQGADRVGGRPV